MMNAVKFVSLWNDVIEKIRTDAEAAGVPEVADDLQLVKAQQSLLSNPLFPSEAARFLVEAGLPESCAPFLSFGALTEGPLPLVQLLDASQLSSSELSRLACLFVLGSDNYGDPLCLDSSRRGAIVSLNHEDQFQTSRLVASSVASLAEALLLINAKVPYSEFLSRLRALDPDAADASAYFPTEAKMPG